MKAGSNFWKTQENYKTQYIIRKMSKNIDILRMKQKVRYLSDNNDIRCKKCTYACEICCKKCVRTHKIHCKKCVRTHKVRCNFCNYAFVTNGLAIKTSKGLNHENYQSSGCGHFIRQ